MKKPIIAALVVVVVLAAAGFGWYYMNKNQNGAVVTPTGTEQPQVEPNATTTPMETPEDKTETVIGQSVGGRNIVAYHFGTGDTEILFVGGTHGGYSWNTSLVAYEAIDYLKTNPSVIPANVKVTVIPVLNPDGLSKVVDASARFSAADITASQAVQISGRYNGRNVDLNRNFDCDWQSTGKWQNVTVNAGTSAFSEPETIAIRQYVQSQNINGVVVWYSAAGGVFSSNCHNGVLAETNSLNSAYSKASGYRSYESFDFYATTGDMTNWLARINIPAISVLLTNHTDTEWSKNKAGIEAILQHYAQ